jgi:hypothetical protein
VSTAVNFSESTANVFIASPAGIRCCEPSRNCIARGFDVHTVEPLACANGKIPGDVACVRNRVETSDDE